ncbi:uncharacterized protein BO97DRAFT_459555 [Aspergillus homomorphus CBS 101889]|uniref:Uncharacterized protein n=1 Tax=Aspergillus homomorphus (strain CBS 101889) TaxID=1450537 RepID=A0A395HMF0_ASPHC|nr:hypothetical protein BO97DRAFT_459555 [Aspergillus homomorphus CBS 101889]RAL09111.1 hypothetical protein BO97DRAFT_459555 [Aspergillus homomorphus CBS 101889]
MASPRDGYVSDTSPKPYDQIIVLSQKVINNGFKNMWKIAQDDPDSPLNYFEKTMHGEEIKAYIGVPSVRLHVESRLPMLYFKLAFTKGTLKVYESDDSEEMIDFDVKDWVLVFNVDINQKLLSKDSDEYKQFKHRAGLSESNFSLAQLYVDASASTQLNEELTSLGDKTLADLASASRSSVTVFIEKWITSMRDKGESVLGFAAQRDDSTGSGKVDGPKQDGADANALSYLLTTDFKNPPAEGAIPYSGPWVDGDTRLGAFCMSRDLLWPWLLPLLRKLVLAMTPVPELPHCVWKGTDEDLPYETGPRYHVGEDSPLDTDYHWKEHETQKSRWGMSATRKEESNKAFKPNHHEDNMKATEWVDDVEASVVYEAGAERLTLQGCSTFEYDLYHDRTDYDPTDFYTYNSIEWKIVLDMTSIEEGGLIWEAGSTEKSVDIQYYEGGDMKMSHTAEDLANNIASDLKKNLALALNRETGTLVEALANANRLCLPGAGTFFMKDPIFNQNGDILVKLEYDGADPPPPPKKGKYRVLPRELKTSVRRADPEEHAEMVRRRDLARAKQ